MKVSAYKWFLMAAAAAMLIFNMTEVFTMQDDLLYRFMWNTDEEAPLRRVTTWQELWQSQIAHFQLINGRFFVHLLAQSVLAFVPDVLFKVVNSFMFVLFLHVHVRLLTADRSKYLSTAVIMCFLLFFVIVGFKSSLIWNMGAFNYLWVLTLNGLFLLYLRRISDKPAAPVHWLAAPLSLLAGWSHEALSLPLSFSMCVFIILNRRHILRRALLPYLLFYIVGSLMCVAAPGLMHRAMDELTLFNRIFSGAINFIVNLRIFWLLLLVSVIVWRRDKDLMKTELSHRKYGYLALIPALAIIFLCGTHLERVAFMADFIAMMLLLSLLLRTSVFGRWRHALTVAGCWLMLLAFIPVVALRIENYSISSHLIGQLEDPGKTVIVARTPAYRDNWLVSAMRDRFTIPTCRFDFFSLYNNINLRYCKAYFHKEKLVFMPEPVMRRIESDTTAYERCTLVDNANLCIVRLHHNRPVKKMKFVLDSENTSELGFPERLLAYQGDVYEPEDFRFWTVTIDQRRFLVFSCPTKNIFRRINHVVWSEGE
ncbi:MAG: hypothetical protein IJV45_10410 [Prevotella sp.]|nr:hypothetical protein [Prevotella sp.]